MPISVRVTDKVGVLKEMEVVSMMGEDEEKAENEKRSEDDDFRGKLSVLLFNRGSCRVAVLAETSTDMEGF